MSRKEGGAQSDDGDLRLMFCVLMAQVDVMMKVISMQLAVKKLKVMTMWCTDDGVVPKHGMKYV